MTSRQQLEWNAEAVAGAINVRMEPHAPSLSPLKISSARVRFRSSISRSIDLTSVVMASAAGAKLRDTHIAYRKLDREHDFSFNEAMSFVVHCADQNEVDTFTR